MIIGQWFRKASGHRGQANRLSKIDIVGGRYNDGRAEFCETIGIFKRCPNDAP